MEANGLRWLNRYLRELIPMEGHDEGGEVEAEGTSLLGVSG